jgi:DNA-directed RNA polymerase subunit alpha
MTTTLWKGFQRPRHLEVDDEVSNDLYGRFTAQPFERGFGTTIGNAMRRVLLSSIEGAAITAVRIDGVLHEFSPVPGATEDATDLILNLKKLSLKLHVDHPKTIYLKTSEPGEVRAKHITPDADIEILDPEAYIATLSNNSSMSIEMVVKPGRGYVSAEKNFDEGLSIGWIPVDSVHSPVKKVNYFVEAARVGQATDYEKLTLEVWTNGATTPRDAVGLAARLVREHMLLFMNIPEEAMPMGPAADDAAAAPADGDRDALREKLARRIDDLELPVRAYNCLTQINVKTVGELVVKTESELLRINKFGQKSLNETKDQLRKWGLSLGMRVSPELLKRD